MKETIRIHMHQLVNLVVMSQVVEEKTVTITWHTFDDLPVSFSHILLWISMNRHNSRLQ